MAITVNLSNITVDLTTGIGTVVDGSTYTSPTRATVGVYLRVYKTDYAGSRSYLTTTPNLADANVDSQWTFPFSGGDGWHQLAYVAVPDYAGGTSYAKYDAAFDPTNKIVYRSKSAGNIGNALNNTTFWEVIPDPSALAFNIGLTTQSVNLNTNTSAAVYNIVLNPITKQAAGTQAGQAFLEASSDYRRSQDVRLWELLDLAVVDMDVCNSRQEYSLGEIAARRASYLIQTS